MRTYFTSQNAFYIDPQSNCIVILDVDFHGAIYLFERNKLYY